MENSTSLHFDLTVYVDIGFYRYPAFLLCFLLYAIVIFANLVSILVISQERTLHEPMYIFIAFLSVNSLYGSTGFFPRFLMDLLSDSHFISQPACYTQIYIVYTYAVNEMTLLTIMAYDRYVAVCDPLHYHSRMTPKTVSMLAACAFIYPAFVIGLGLYLVIRLPLCSTKIQKLYCAIWSVAKLSCVTTVINNIYGLIVTIITAVIPLPYVLFTYFQIILVCRKSSSEFKSKVFHTCLPHTVLFVIYSVNAFCDITLSRLSVEYLSPALASLVSLEFVIVPPILNPLIYGLKLPEIRRNIFKLFSKHLNSQ